MPKQHPPELRQQAGHLVTTTDLPLSEIGRRIDVPQRTLERWKREERWVRPSAKIVRLKIPPEKYAAIQRLYEKRGTLADIAVVAECSIPWITKTAALKGWTPRKESAARGTAPPKPLGAALAEIQAALRDPTLTRGDVVKLLERAVPLAAADALGGDRDAERNVQTLTRLAALVKSLPDTAAPPAREEAHADPADYFPDANDLIEEIARRFEAFGNDLLHPRVLAAVAETVP
jgi:hypothetical protein